MPKKDTQGNQRFKVPGFFASGIACGIKKNGRKDLALILSEAPAAVAGLFTTNSVKAAPVLIDLKRIKKGRSSGVLVNSGNANACTGKEGHKNALDMLSTVERGLRLKAGSLLIASTGVIGVPLPVKRVTEGAPLLIKSLRSDGLMDANEAMMTTDAFPKRAVRKFKAGGATLTVAGIAKGAGMICPDMATLLSFFMTDAKISAASLKKALKLAVDGSFNSIIVDNDTSTNDTALLFASGATGAELKEGSAGFEAFVRALSEVSLDLAKMIVRDGEGATRLIELDLRGASSAKAAKAAVRTIAGSFLVKTAFFGGDPNWGRIMAAMGRAGIRFDEKNVTISFNGVPVVKNGLDTGREKAAAKALKKTDVNVRIELNGGAGSAKLWTSDLSYGYVKINSAYRT